MDSSPNSLTQSNDGRSYEQYLPRGDDLISSDPVRRPHLSHSSQQPSSVPGNTGIAIHDDDTAQVEFDYSAIARIDTQTSVPESTRIGPNTQQQQQHHATSDYVFGNPETPAAPRNPFWGSKPASLMPSSQMFKQYSSAFKATFSPTSSRPSPDNLHLNSISPNPSPLKRVTTAPSPLQGASSFPQLPLGFDTSPQQTDERDPPADDDEIARSHISKSFHLPAHVPIEEYRPVQRWDLRAASAQSGSDMEDGPDEDLSDEEERRRQRAALIRAKVQKRLKAIPLERQSDEAIVPATNHEEVSPAARRYLDQCDGVSRRDSQSSVEDLQDAAQDIADSQDGIIHQSADLPGQPSAGDHGSSNDVVPNTDPGPTSAPIQTDDELPVQVPETSPPRLRALGDLMPHSSEDVSKPESFSKLLSSPLANAPAESPPVPLSRPPQQRTRAAVDAEGEDSGIDADNNAGGSCVIVSSSPPAPAFSTRARLRGGRPSATAPPTSSTSPLSRLTTTPALSNKTTPLTEESPRNGLTLSLTSTYEADSSPAVAKAHRQKSRHVVKPAPTNLRASTRRTTRQSFPSNISVSTDELAGSPRPSTPTLEQTARMSRLGRTSLRESPASRTNSRGGSKIFSGMAFAISFQGKKPGEKDAQYKARMTTSDAITAKIKQAGGKVLPDGFDHLFEFVPVKNADREASSVSSTPQPDDDIVLAPQARDTGFTALIADGHSRKAKYMQALALGLPCIHERWITACVDKQRLVDWADYLLCAGNSSFLGDAIRSRNLSPYDAATAKLGDVIQYRPRLLDQSRILLLMTRADESRKEAYVFLARVLGASLSRVYTVEEARRQLKAREDAGRTFDWIYVVDDKVDVEEIFVSRTAGAAEGSRKRKRRGDTGKGDLSTAPPAKRVRALSDELVIQSLILGRLMEEGEMKPRHYE
ncbi:radiation sensitive protein rad9 [Gnomoniopsis smithogilvyi]|uniref:Radiation sensitive protein rad9 n=1 Tax=Gnomoniopsis smithogilvyi TaxID=1191159 RepID=A0A9W8YT66_9PEZI|nr:radiation sensitive protein rad9 [Gnomoniopsis smithogilvyi]